MKATLTFRQRILAGSTNAAGKNLSSVNLSGSTGLTGFTAAQLAATGNIRNVDLRGTGITKAQLETALIANNRRLIDGYDTSTIIFD